MLWKNDIFLVFSKSWKCIASKHMFVALSHHGLVFKKLMSKYFDYKQGAPNSIEGEFCATWFTFYGLSKPISDEFCIIVNPES